MNISQEKLKKLIYDISISNSQESFRIIYITFYPKIFRFVMYYVRSETLAEEVISDTFVSIWEQRKDLLGVHDFNSYVYRIAKNISINYLRKKVSNPENIQIEQVLSNYNPVENPESEFISSELMSRLNMAIVSLPEKCRLVFMLIREENMKYKEVASMLNISIKTTEAHMSLAVKKIREILKDELKG